ncbi:MAG TPA: DUF4287 domain-containing protein [Blastocatellia bacterium]|nr:DUF4287 domain-containing protein [Blastocatellia bacterium]
MKAEAQKAAPISDEAVQAKTGKNWSQWFATLDKAGAAKMTHKEIAAHLAEKHQIGNWWCQMVAVTYEQARGLRDKHQKMDGYSVSGSRIVAVPVATLFRAWNDKRARNRWLPDVDLTIRRATENKSLRITWADGRTDLDVNLYEKGVGKSQVAVEHSKLKDAKHAAEMKAYWAGALDRLKAALEGQALKAAGR